MIDAQTNLCFVKFFQTTTFALKYNLSVKHLAGSVFFIIVIIINYFNRNLRNIIPHVFVLVHICLYLERCLNT